MITSGSNIKFSLFILLEIRLTFVRVQAYQVPHAIRSGVFTDIKDGKRLSEMQPLSTDLLPQGVCIKKCMRVPLCRSINYCRQKLCQLNSEDVFSNQRGYQLLQNDINCKYIGMEKDEAPSCDEGGNPRDIKIDEPEGLCMINRKRVDSKVEEDWTAVFVDNRTDFQDGERREFLMEAAHGGNVSDTRRNFVWYKFVKERMTWHDARAHCVEIGGELFSDVDGTEVQLQFFQTRLGRYWLGIYTEDHQVWKTIHGEVVSKGLLAWADGQPNNAGGNQFAVACTATGKNRDQARLFDGPFTEKRSFSCNMVI